MKRRRWKLGVAVLVVVALGAGGWAVWFRGEDETYDYFTSAVSRGDIRNTIASTGKVSAMVMVEVGSQVTGQVISLYADFNSVVTEGQILARLDPKTVQTQLRNSQANLTAARSRIGTAEADLENARTNIQTDEANLAQARADLEQADLNLDRARTLHEGGLVSDTELENSETSARSARVRVLTQEASLQQARTQILSRQAAIEQANAGYEQAQADLEEAELNVDYTVIRSPVSGVVISREVDVGQTVSASTSAPTLFLIANDLGRMRIQASIDEADIGLLGQDNEVTFRVDAYPATLFTGHIEEIRLNPSTSQNVVTYSVIITFDNPDMKLKPGMTANITILVDKREDTLSVPNTALRYQPPNASELLAAAAPAQAAGGAPAQTAADAPAGRGRGDFGRGGRGPGEGFQPPEGFEGFAGRGQGGRGGGARGQGGRGGGGRGGNGNNAGGSSDDAAPQARAATIVAPATGSVYMPGQEWGDSLKIQFQPLPPDPPTRGRVWVLSAAGVPEPRELMVGLTDGSITEVVSGTLEAGDLVLIGDSSEPSATTGNNNFTDDPARMLQILSGGGRGGGRGGRGNFGR